MEQRRRFLTNLAVLAAVWAFVNWPRDAGPLKQVWRSAGFPWTFASWTAGRLERFDAVALAADVAVGLVVVVPVAWLFARPQRFAPSPTASANPAASPGPPDGSAPGS